MFFDSFNNRVLANIFNIGSPSPLPSSYWLGLSSTKPNSAGTNISEPSASTGYKRVKLNNLELSSDDLVTNSSAISFETSTDSWGTVSYYVIFDSETGGNPCVYGALPSPLNVIATTSITIKAGGLDILITNVNKTVLGFYGEGTFYQDATLSQVITPREGVVYFDILSGHVYMWNLNRYIDVGDV